MSKFSTAERKEANKTDEARPFGSVVVSLETARLPITSKFAEQLGVTAGQWRVLVDQIFPSAKTVEAIAMALAYCRSRNLDIFKKPVHIVPMWSSAKRQMVETVWPGIAEIRTTATRTGEYAGIDEVEYGPMVERTFAGFNDGKEINKTVRFPEWASVTVYRMVNGVRCPFHAKVYWEETYATLGKTEVPNDMWAKRPRGQLDKCVEAAALRKAFPEELGNTYAAEEMEGREISEGVTIDLAQVKQTPVPPKPPAFDHQQKPTIDHVADGIDADSEDDTATDDHNDEYFDDRTYFERLEEALAVANDLETVEEVWTEFDPMARFDGKPNGEVNQAIAMQIRKRAEKRIEAAK